MKAGGRGQEAGGKLPSVTARDQTGLGFKTHSKISDLVGSNQCRSEAYTDCNLLPPAFFTFYSLPCALPPASIGKYTHLSCDVNINERFMHIDRCAIIQQTIKLRLLVSKNTKSCAGKLACTYY